MPPGRAFRAEPASRPRSRCWPRTRPARRRPRRWPRSPPRPAPGRGAPARAPPVPGRRAAGPAPFADAWELRDAALRRPLWALAGVGGDELTAPGPTWATACPVRDRRAAEVRPLHDAGRWRAPWWPGTQVILVAPRRRRCARWPASAACWASSRPDLSEADLRAALGSAGGPGVVLSTTRRCCGTRRADELRDIINIGGDRRRGPGPRRRRRGPARGFSGWQVDARRARRGLLSPQSPRRRPDRDPAGAQPGRRAGPAGEGACSTSATAT